MFEWKIIIILIILQVLSFIFNLYYEKKEKDNNIEPEDKNICITPLMKDFLMIWIKYSQNIFTYSSAIIKESSNINEYYDELNKTKENLINIFSKINNKYGKQFENLINNQVDIKTDLCYAILNQDKEKIKEYSEELTENTNQMGILFSEIKKDKMNDLNLKKTMNSNTNKYIKSLKFVKKADNDELSRELVLGSIDIAKLLFI